MRTTRAAAIAIALLSLLPELAAAQLGRPFKDAWFWGVKGGTLMATVPGRKDPFRPMVGGEWLITRSRGALYVSMDYAQLRDTIAIREGVTVGGRPIDLKNMRRVNAVGLAFPGHLWGFRPYAGLGLNFSQLSDAQPVGTMSVSQESAAQDTIMQRKASFSPMVMAGGQWTFMRFSIFGQATATASQKRFFLYDGKAWTPTLEFGLRYNVGSSIDRN